MARQTATAVAVSMALLTTGEHAVAQSASELEVRVKAGAAASARTGSFVPGNAFAVTPSVRYETPRFAIDANSVAWLTGQRWQFADGSARAVGNAPLFGSLRAELVTDASRVMVDPANVSSQVEASGRLHLIRDRGGVWLGSGIVHPLRIATVSNVNVSSGGVWTKLGATTLRATVTNFYFTKLAGHDTLAGGGATSCPVTQASAPDIGPIGSSNVLGSSASACRRESHITDVEGGVKFDYRVVELSVRGGQRYGQRVDVTPESRSWGSAQAAIWLSSQLAAVAGGGSEPAQPTRGLPARRFASLGVMLAYWPIPRGAVPVVTPASLVHAFEMRPAGEALQRLTARIGGVERVEVMGDFSDWSPIPLVRRGRDQWELLIPMGPGVHQINMRIDGGKWIAPPGIPSIRDDFNGEVGVLVIKP